MDPDGLLHAMSCCTAMTFSLGGHVLAASGAAPRLSSLEPNLTDGVPRKCPTELVNFD